MSFLPNPESVLLNLYQWAGSPSQATVSKQRFVAHDMKLTNYQAFLRTLLTGLANQFELDDEQSELWQFYFLQFANQLYDFNQKIHSYKANEQQVNWEVLARFHLPQIGRWLGLLCVDGQISPDFVQLLPQYDDEQKALRLPVQLAMDWLFHHYGDTLEHFANVRCEQFPNAGFKEKDSILRNLYHWKNGKLPDANSIKSYFPDELELGFVSDNPPTMKHIRQTFLLARVFQAAFMKAHEYFSPNADIHSSDLHANKAYQLVYIGKYIFDLTVFAYQKFNNKKQADIWFDEQLGNYGKAVFAHILNYHENDEMTQFSQSVGFKIPDDFARKTIHFETLNRYFMSLTGTEELSDFFDISPDKNLKIQQDKIHLYQTYKRNANEYLMMLLALNPITAKTLGVFRQPETLLKECDNLAVIKGLLGSGIFVAHKQISRLLIERAEQLSQTPDDELFVIQSKLHRYLYTDQRKNDKNAPNRVKALLEQAVNHPSFPHKKAQIHHYQARDALSRNDFQAAKQFYRQALEASKTGCYGDWRGRVGLDLLTLETLDKKLNHNNHETYYRDMLVGGVFNCFMKVDLPATLEDTVEQLLLDGNHWETMYIPYYGFENQSIQIDKNVSHIMQTFFKLISDEPYFENKVIDWIKQHKKVLAKPLPSVEGGNALMSLLKLISKLKKSNDLIHRQEINKMIFAMRRAVFLLVQYVPESLDNRDFKQQNPLMFPAEWADFDLIDLMLKQGARPDTLDYQGMTPLHAIIKTHSQSCFDLMLSVNPDLMVKTTDGQTLLHTASKFGNVYAVENLVKREPQLKNEKDFYDEIPLEQAERVLINIDYWHTINNVMKKHLPQSHWQQIIDKLRF